MPEDYKIKSVIKRTPWEKVIYWKLAILKVLGKAFIGMLLSMAQALNGAEWSAFTSTQKFCAVTLSLGAGWTVVDAFLDQTMSRLTAEDKALIAKETSAPSIHEETTVTPAAT